MSGKRDDGGCAFAAIATSAADDVYHQTGMSLRDWFAGQALIGMLHNGFAPRQFLGSRAPEGPQPPREYPAIAYALADAMLAERSKP